MERVALVTGGAGFLGSWLIRALAQRNYRKLYVLARRNARHSARSRVYQALTAHSKSVLLRQVHRAVEVVEGDFCEPRLGLPDQRIRSILTQLTDIFHVGATADLGTPLSSLRPTNVIGTKCILDTALSISRAGRPLRVHHVSTVAVAGTLQGWFKEDQLDCGQRFHNAYEQSKFEAEKLIHRYRVKGLDITIYRPGIITGDSKTGSTINFKMFYQPLHLLSLGLVKELPAIRNCLHSLVPVDKVAEAICLLSEADQTANRTWHLVNPSEVPLEHFLEVASDVLGFSPPALIPLERFPKGHLTSLQWKLIGPYVPYFNYRLRFEAAQTNRRLVSLGFQWPRMDDAMLTRLFRYCIRCGFIPPRFHVSSRLPSV